MIESGSGIELKTPKSVIQDANQTFQHMAGFGNGPNFIRKCGLF